MKRLLLLSTLGAFALGGCVAFKDRPLSAMQTADSFQGRSLSDAGLRQFLAEQGAGGGSWNVDRLALAAAYFHPAVRVARAQAEEARAGVVTAAQRPNPTLTFSPQYSANPGSLSPWIVMPQLNVPIETAGKRGKRVVGAQTRAQAAQLRVAAVAWDARTLVRAAMLDLYGSQENLRLLATEVALHDEALWKLDTRVKAGDAPAFELNQARLGLNRSMLAQHDAQRLAATARERLASAVGVPPAVLDAVRLDFSAFESLPAVADANARRRALTHRSDLLAALADYAAADADLRIEIARQFPDIQLQPSYEFDQGENRWGLGLQVQLPILNQNRGPIAEADARRKTAGERFEARQAAVFGEIGAASAAYRTAAAKVATATRLAGEARHASDTTSRMVEAGELASFELTRHKIEASAASLALIEARVQAQQAAGQFEAALQLPLRSLK